jgi:hypothetical protein
MAAMEEVILLRGRSPTIARQVGRTPNAADFDRLVLPRVSTSLSSRRVDISEQIAGGHRRGQGSFGALAALYTARTRRNA